MRVKRIFDLSPTLGDEIPYYPGDVIFRAEPLCTLESSGCNMHRLLLGTHSGSHLDAPLHFLAGGSGADEIELDRLIGEAEVLEVKGKEIGPQEVQSLTPGVERVLFKTGNSPLMRRGTFQRDYVFLSMEGAEALLERKVKLVGIDYISIERFGTPDFAVHKRLLQEDVVILEGLTLEDVPPGRYFLVALPLKLRGMDGAPLRAALLELSP